MKLNTFLLAFFSLISFSFVTLAQEHKNFPVSNFDGIGIGNGIELTLKQGSTESVEITTDAKTIQDIEVVQKGRSIEIRLKKKSGWNWGDGGRKIKAAVSFKNLTALAASGGTNVTTLNPINTNSLSISSSGGARLNLAISCKNLALQSSGGTNLQLTGKAESFSLAASGGSELRAFGLVVDKFTASTSGAAQVEVYVNKSITANASGGSSISYKGNPTQHIVSNSKSGNVNHVQ